MNGVDMERPWVFVGADGTRYFSGVMRSGKIVEIYNADTVAIAAGEAVIADAATSVWSRWDLPTTSDAPKQVVGGKRVAAVASVGFLGAALENIPVGKVGRVGGRGYWMAVKCVNPPTSNAVGAAATGSATVGSCEGLATELIQGRSLGIVLMPAGAGAGQIGSTTQFGVDINPH